MIRLLSDFVAIRPDPPVERVHGKIIIPATVDTAADSGWIEEGTVVAVGPGDKFLEKWADNSVKRTLITKACADCGGVGRIVVGGCCESCPDEEKVECDCDGSGRVPVTVPPQCNVGDRVLYVAGRAGDWTTVDGERLYVIHEEQFVLAVIEREEAQQVAA